MASEMFWIINGSRRSIGKISASLKLRYVLCSLCNAVPCGICCGLLVHFWKTEWLSLSVIAAPNHSHTLSSGRYWKLWHIRRGERAGTDCWTVWERDVLRLVRSHGVMDHKQITFPRNLAFHSFREIIWFVYSVQFVFSHSHSTLLYASY